jgi:hypothetical protein
LTIIVSERHQSKVPAQIRFQQPTRNGIRHRFDSWSGASAPGHTQTASEQNAGKTLLLEVHPRLFWQISALAH